MRRVLRWIGRLGMVLVALPVLAIGLVLLLGNIGPGRALIEAQTESLTGGMVRIQDLAGRFPDALRVGQIEVSDAKGPYVTIRNVTLDWSALRLLTGTAHIDAITARSIDVSRLPQSSGPSSTSGGSFSLPVRVDLGRLHVDQFIIGEAVAGAAATLSLDGSGFLETLTSGNVRLLAKRLDSPGVYEVSGTVAADHIQASVKAQEPPKGLISTLAKLPDLGAIAIQASVDGPQDGLVTQAGMQAGQLSASASGTVDLAHEAADLVVNAQAPAMAPADGVSWRSVLINAKVKGAFTTPDATGTVRIKGLEAGGARIGTIDADVAGNAGRLEMHASIGDLHLPGPDPDVLAAAPVKLDVAARIADPDRPVTFALRHPLIAIDGSARTEGDRTAQAHVVIADLVPLAALGGVDIQGGADLTLKATMTGDTTTASVAGKVGIIGGMSPVPALVGPDGAIDVAAELQGQDVTLRHLTVKGKTLLVSAQGSLTDQIVDLDWGIKLTDLAAVAPNVSGKVEAKGKAVGKPDDLAVTADIGADVATKEFSPGHITARIDAGGLPNRPHASVTADGRLLDAPLSLALTGDRVDGVVHATIDHLGWKSLKAAGQVTLPSDAILPRGTLRLTMSRLADLQPLIGQAIAGDAAVALDLDEQAARVDVSVRNAAVPGTASIATVLLKAVVTDPIGHPVIDGTLTADRLSAASVQGASVRVTARGPIDALAATVSANAQVIEGGPARLSTAGTLNVTGRSVALQTLEATWKQQVVRMLGPTRIVLADGISIESLRLGFRQAVLSVSGSAGSQLDLTASLRNLPADVAAIADPSLAMDGSIEADVRLTGTTGRPEGTVRVTASRVRMRQGPGRGLPPADLSLNAILQGIRAQVDSRLVAGPSHLTASGTVPLSADGALNLRTDGRVDLAMLDPILAAQGRRVRGMVMVNASATGTTAAPRITGTMVLSNGDVTDFAAGAHVSDITATVQATGDTITLSQLTGHAGPGTLGGGGTISLAGQMPVDLRFTANNARPIAGDLVTALLNVNVTVQGQLKGNLQVGGSINIIRADIRVPETIPSSVAVLPIYNPNAPPAPPAAPGGPSMIALNLTITAPEQVFIRGRGLDAELGGTIHIRGTTADPAPEGGFHLRHGTLSVIGTTLTFTTGTVDFNGAGIGDPELNFVATSTNASMTASLTISGEVKNPKITLSSVPDMPQDEILAQILFNTSASKLGPLQLAQIAAALATLSGATSGIGDPLDKIRTSLGLDRLTVGSDNAGNPMLEAGRYIARGVYVGARQSASGNGTQAIVQVDIAKGLKAEATAGTGTTNATGSTSTDAASVGIKYQFEY